jgi:hypothetical protein
MNVLLKGSSVLRVESDVSIASLFVLAEDVEFYFIH